MSLISGGVKSNSTHNAFVPMSKNRKASETKSLKRFGVRLKALRLSRGLTQETIAAEAGFSRSYYTEIETGKRNISLLNLQRLALVLKVSMKELVDLDGKGND